ncbi:PEP/pyruvate-binding domain-containing protein [Vibrio mangrovi]|uniref:Prodigiosin synthesizing transferase PigC n=1 Tax=Vibrio mangrovi TaxID=474394 RepID=A0A1Y6INE5_9VIBR|nr:PEP/pyruvate-binding domain-containing protein [Vibrio mangrovi]MDW6004017.1 PEP/pyruvate-binding domain-containing protein [Vibrio mangrovi]SMR99185.1 Phosphoenolpyruvate synthase [Vibrio mangrovi]
MTDSNIVVGISGDQQLAHQHLGGKAYSLNHLVHAGLPVPVAFCVTADAYQQFIRETLPAPLLTSGEMAQVRETILNADIPESIKQAIQQAYQNLGENPRIAVRSSALDEDGQSQSFAGQYETYLHVQGIQDVLHKVRSCWASLWADRAELYRQEHRQGHVSQSAIAVVLQEMIDADAAGVMFTRDPLSGNQDHVVIDSCWGLGEGVVSGQVTTDTFTLDKATGTVIAQEVRSKPNYCQCDDKGRVTILPTPEPLRDVPSLSQEHLAELNRLARQARLIYGTDLDIEWAVKDNKVWLLQARPVTTEAKAATVIYANPWETRQSVKEGALFSRMDTGEIVTGLMTPLGLSFCQYYQKHIHGPAIQTMGMADISDWTIYMGYIQGHVYLNISGSAHMLRQCPPTRDEMKFTTRYATDDIDFSHYQNPYGPGVQGWDYAKSAWHWLKQQIHNVRHAPKIVEQMIELRQQETKRFLALDLSKMTLADLNRELERADKYFLESCAAYMPFFLQSFALYDALTETCDKYLGDQGNGLQNRIKASMNNLRTIEVTLGIIKLVETINRQPQLKKLFEQHDASELADILQQDSEGRTFWNGPFEAFLFEFGARGRQEFELSIPRWRDDPSYLLQVMKMYLQHPVNLQEKLKETETLRNQDSAQLLNGLPRMARLKLKMLMKLYGVMAERREATRPTFITETWFYRIIMLEVLGRLESKEIVRREDLPYIDFQRFRDYVAGRISADEAFSADVLNENRHQHLLNTHADEPPLAIIGGYTPQLRVAASDNTDQLKGLAASPGQIVAKARVITDLQAQAGELQPGEILVARFTDASWTPLFALAGGVVTDIGSALSHSCIVAREFGIPAVVNLKTATQQIKSGDTLIVDGDNGHIMIQRQEE